MLSRIFGSFKIRSSVGQPVFDRSCPGVPVSPGHGAPLCGFCKNAGMQLAFYVKPFRALVRGRGGDEADLGGLVCSSKCHGSGSGSSSVSVFHCASGKTVLCSLHLIYRGVAAVLQPVADKRLVVCLSGAAQAQKML